VIGWTPGFHALCEEPWDINGETVLRDEAVTLEFKVRRMNVLTIRQHSNMGKAIVDWSVVSDIPFATIGMSKVEKSGSGSEAVGGMCLYVIRSRVLLCR
jgi:hypothetical protein